MKLAVKMAMTGILLAAAQPCLAAEDFRIGAETRGRVSAFAGLSARLSLGQRARRSPTARLVAGMATSRIDARSGRSLGLQAPTGLELGLDRDGRLRPFVAGSSTASFEKRLGIRGSGGRTLLIAGGIAAAAVAGILIFGDSGSSACIPEDPDCD
ncbi:MAG TPA: hypothetical protein VF548_06215 [Allosphingosinicella sp.]|jgi:hypothetical protein